MSNATARKSVRSLLTSLTLVNFFSTLAGEKNNSEMKALVKEHGLAEVLDATAEVLRTQVSGTRGRPALEEQPIHTMLKAMREAARFANEEGVIDREKAARVIVRAVKVAERQQAQLQARRSLFKPSKRIQGTKRMPVLEIGEGAKA